MNLEKINTGLEGCYLLKPTVFSDRRGSLTKIFHRPTFEDLDLVGEFSEEYYSISKQNVLRGLHFQLPPHDHCKIIICLSGKIFDVVVDLRKSSPTYKKFYSITLDANDPCMLYIPRGFAHGFLSLAENSIFLNKTDTVYNQDSDAGIKWDSCGINWPIIEPLVSIKDQNLPDLHSFNSPF
jgi:dTDP-4-dehydrorhamnose 3,5-epimerase